MEGLVWMFQNDPSMGDAEFIVRAAKNVRWRSARFSGEDCQRAMRAIENDKGYLSSVFVDADTHARSAGVGSKLLYEAKDRILIKMGAPGIDDFWDD